MDKKSLIAMMALWGIFVQPAQAAPEQINVLEEIDKFGKQTLCPFICSPPLFPPILCGITEIKNQCLEKCKGATYLHNRIQVDLTGCGRTTAKPFKQVAQQTLDKFCYFACNRVSCSNITIPFPTKGGIVKIPWPGNDFGNTICKSLCKEEKIKNCLKSAEGGFGFEPLRKGEPVELP